MKQYYNGRVIQPYQAPSRIQWERSLQRLFCQWLEGTQSTSGLQGYLGGYTRKWGEDAQTRVIASALNEWTRPTA